MRRPFGHQAAQPSPAKLREESQKVASQLRLAADIRNWSDCGIDVCSVAINAAPAEFLRDDYAEQLLTLIAEQDVSPQQIEVEITEYAFLVRDDLELSLTQKVAASRRRGYSRIAVHVLALI